AGSSGTLLYWATPVASLVPGARNAPSAGPGHPVPSAYRRIIVNDELTTPQEDELTDALDVAGALEEDAAARLETAAVIAEAADEAEAEAIAEGSYAEAERIEEVADEAIEELVVEAAVEDAAAEEIE